MPIADRAVTEGPDPAAYTTVSALIDVLDDNSWLEGWRQRQILRALVLDWDDKDGSASKYHGPHLWDRLRGVVRRNQGDDDPAYLLNPIIWDAFKVTDTGQWARRGTTLHSLTEYVDRGEELPEGTSDSDRRDIAAYSAAMEQLGAEPVLVERKLVNDEFRARGRLDRGLMVKLPGFAAPRLLVGDIKTGDIMKGNGKLSMQLAAYANGHGYDPRRPTERVELGLDREIGLLIHLPSGEGRCDIYPIDIEAGYGALRLARAVHDWRNVSGDVRPDEPLLSAYADDEELDIAA